MHLLFLFFLLPLVTTAIKTVAVKGKLLWGEHPAFNTLIRLWPNPKEKGYDVLGEEYTAMDGSFLIKGEVFTENSHITLKVYHDCDDGMKPGQRKFSFHIPSKYASNSEDAEPFEFGILNLETRFKHDEERQTVVDRRRKRKHIKRRETIRSTTSKTVESDESPEDRIEPW